MQPSGLVAYGLLTPTPAKMRHAPLWDFIHGLLGLFMDLIIIEEAYKEDLSEITGEINLKGNFGDEG